MRVCAGARSVLPILLPVTHGLHGFRYLALHTTGRVPASVWEHRAAFEAHCLGLPLRVNLPRRAEPQGSLRFHCASAPAVASEWGPRSCQAVTGVRARQGCRGLATSAPGGTPGLCAGALRVRPRSSPSVLPVGDAPCPPLLLPPSSRRPASGGRLSPTNPAPSLASDTSNHILASPPGRSELLQRSRPLLVPCCTKCKTQIVKLQLEAKQKYIFGIFNFFCIVDIFFPL